MKTTLIATKSFSYGGRSIKPGGEFEATGQHARLLVGIGKATYQTRDMVAAPAPSPAPAPAPRSADAPEAPPAPPAPAPAARQTAAAKKTARKTAGKSSE